MQLKPKSKHLKRISRLACVIQRLERQGVAYTILPNGALRVKQHGKPTFTPHRLTTTGKCVNAHKRGRVMFNARGVTIKTK